MFFALAVGFAVGPLKLWGFALGNVTATLLAGVLIGQLGITVAGPIKSTFFLMFLFAVGFGVGPQFFRGLGKEGPRQIVFSLARARDVPRRSRSVRDGRGPGRRLRGRPLCRIADHLGGDRRRHGSDRSTRAATRPRPRRTSDAIPIGYAVTYIFGTIGSAIVLAQLGPKLIGVDLAAACAEYQRRWAAAPSVLMRGVVRLSGHRVARVLASTLASGLDGQARARPFSWPARLRRAGPARRELHRRRRRHGPEPGDDVGIVGPHRLHWSRFGSHVPEVHDPTLLDMPATLVDVFVTNRRSAARRLRQLADKPFARGSTSTDHAEHGRDADPAGNRNPARRHPDPRGHCPPRRSGRQGAGLRRSAARVHRLKTVAGGIFIGGLIGALTVHLGGIPLGLSTSGGALLAGLVVGYLRTIRPTFGRIPTPALVLMNTLGLNVFIAIVGINAGPGFVAGLQQVGLSLFLWGIVATSIPMIIAVLLGHYVFKFHPAILFGVCAGVRTTTAALGMIQDAAQEQGPRARIWHAVRHRQHAAHDLRHGGRADHAQSG